MSDDERAAMYRRLRQGLSSGLPIVQLLRTEKLATVVARLEQGDTLGAAVNGSPGFPAPIDGLVAAGEKVGALPEVLGEIAGDLDRKRAFVSRIKTALIQPAIVVLLALFVIPIVPALLTQGQDSLLRAYVLVARGPIALALLLVIVIGGIALVIPQTALFALPIVGKLLRLARDARVARVLSLGFRAGLPVRATLELTASPRAAACARAIDGGATFADAVGREKLLPAAADLELRTAEDAGALAPTLARLADDWQDELTRRLAVLGKLATVFITIATAAIAVGTVYRFLSTQAKEVLKALE